MSGKADSHFRSDVVSAVAAIECVGILAETARWSTITQIHEGTNQIQRMVMARQVLKGS
jgi:alkylation response protein AidB-like acyl-CoA dehydrogenase